MNAWKQLILAVATVALPPCLPGQPSVPIALSISAQPAVVKAGEKIRLGVIATNTSGGTVEIYTASGKPDGGEAEDYNGICVRDAEGKLLPRIDGRQVARSDGTVVRMHGPPLSLKPVVLAPGDKFHDFTILNRLFDLTKPGIYTVTVKQEIRLDDAVPEPTRATAASNMLQITIVGPVGEH